MAQTGPPPMKSDRVYLNPGEEGQMEISGFRPHKVKQAIAWFFIIITCGLLFLLFYWLPQLRVKATHSRCSLAVATTVLLLDQYRQWFKSEVNIITKDGKQIIDKKSSKTSFSNPHLTSSGVTYHQSQSGDDNLIRYFITKKIKYIWDPERDEFIRLKGLERDTACSYFYQVKGLSYEDQQKRQVVYGINSIRVHVQPIVKLLFKEVLSPFYVFQVFSVCVWYSDSYELYASCIVFISVFSMIVTIYQTRKMQRALRNTIASSTIVTVCRGNDEYEDISSEDLVPGDVIEVPRYGCVMQCDAVLVSGNCIVNESMLTGESVPVTKTPLPNPHISGPDQKELMFDIKLHSRHILYCGTHVIQTRYYGNQRVKAVVVRTGFQTAKGELVRSILHPKPVDFKFNRHTYFFIGVLAFIASIGFVYTIVLMVGRGDEANDIVRRALDLITITVPPALPAALSVGIVFAQRRLKARGIYCISPRGINICGTINAVCFDKTGTLTEDGLRMQSVVSCSSGRFDPEISDTSKLTHKLMTSAMATCHSLTIIDGRLMGDPLDLIMFEAIDWELEEGGEEETRFDIIIPTIVHPRSKKIRTSADGDNLQLEEIGVVRQFTFSSSLQRMSVVTRSINGSNFDLFSKGAPEMIASLSKPETVPPDFHDILMAYTKHGYRVIALAWKPLPQKLNYAKVQRITREQVEKDLNFLGLLVMENCLKKETSPVIQQLREAEIRNIMITGDNMLTALSVARECCMVDRTDRIILVQAYPPQDGKTGPQLEFVYAEDRDKKVEEITTVHDGMAIQIDDDALRFHFAVTGKSWAVIRQFFPDVLAKIVVKGTVFARMGPEQKAQLVECLQSLGYYVGMCGDGANDCGALKTAHTGISLSEAEASVASPFTSKKPTIECVPAVISEGRAALVTSFGIFKYMACYSLTQFVSVLLLYWIGANLTDAEFLFVDLFTITTLSVTFGYTSPYPDLVKELPPISLIAVGPILSITIQTAIQTGAQVFCFFDVQRQPWFVPYHQNEDDVYTSYENSAVFLISAFQYITLAVTFAKGAPFRRTIFANYFFLVNLGICTAGALWLTLYPPQGLADLMELKAFPSIPYSLVYVGIAIVNFLLSVMVEMFLIDNVAVREKCRNTMKRCHRSAEFKYASIEQEIAGDPTWPPVSSKTVDLAAAFQRMDSAHHVPKDVSAANVLEDLIEDAESDTQSLRSLSSVVPKLQTSAVNAVGRQMSAASDAGDYLDNMEKPLLKISTGNSAERGTTLVEEGGKFTTSL